MLRFFAKPGRLLAVLFLCSLIPILVAAVSSVQTVMADLPTGSLRFAEVPGSFFLHSAGGAVFGLLGPFQFSRALQRRYGRLHRLLGRVFTVAGLGLGFSGLSILVQQGSPATALLDAFRVVAGIGLIVALTIAVASVMQRRIECHRDWIIRAYALGMGSGSTSPVIFPVFLVTGSTPKGLTHDLIVTGAWAATILIAELVIRFLHATAQQRHVHRSLKANSI